MSYKHAQTHTHARGRVSLDIKTAYDGVRPNSNRPSILIGHVELVFLECLGTISAELALYLLVVFIDSSARLGLPEHEPVILSANVQKVIGHQLLFPVCSV